MGDLTGHFSISEFACECGCGFGRKRSDIKSELLLLCEIVRMLNGNKPVTVSSGCRCAAHNATIKNASPNSRHINGEAADIYVDDPKYVYNKLCEMFPNDYGFGLYNNRVHIDCRKYTKARWISA